ncbi:MAG: hypothetical protein LBV00_04420 [Propionibacteriaceae bacterium]|nr:hypothetical protein [Propionibacteriaceae bacterium]
MSVLDFGSGWGLFLVNIILYVGFVAIRRHVDVWLPDRAFDPTKWRYRSAAWERHGAFYRDVLHINRWKDKLPCLVPLTGFSKKSITDVRKDYLSRFIVETCRAESNHVSAVLFTFVLLLWTPLDMWLVCFLIAALGNAPFIMIQRYNRPRLQHALELADACPPPHLPRHTKIATSSMA